MRQSKFTERQGAIMRQSKWKRPPFIRDGVGVIRLTRGAEAIVDIDMLPLVGNKNWYLSSRGKGHKGPLYTIGRGKDGKNVPLHREILRYHGVSIPKGMHVDHINRNPLDNRFANLRVVTPLENRKNSEHYENYLSLYHGVYYMSYGNRRKRWRARIIVDGKDVALGCYLTKEEGATAYVDAAIRFNQYDRVPESMKQMREKGEI